MHRVDHGTRHLPPAIVSDADEIVGPEMVFAGTFADAPALPSPAAVSTTQPAVDLPPVEQDAGWEPSPMPIEGPATCIVSRGAQAPGRRRVAPSHANYGGRELRAAKTPGGRP